MRAKLEQKRALQAKESAEESKANEMIRRKAGQDLGELREEMQKKGESRGVVAGDGGGVEE